MKQKLAPGVVQEPPTSLSPNLEAYWVQQEKGHKRIVARGNRVDDGEIYWTEARLQSYVHANRSLFARLLGKEIVGALLHPSGSQVVSDGSQRTEGHLFTAAKEGIDLEKEIARRMMPFDPSKLTKISPTKMFLHGATPMQVNVTRAASAPERPAVVETPVSKIESLYKDVLKKLPELTNVPQLSAQDRAYLKELQQFTEKRVKWATLEMNGGMTAQEAGQIGDAWLFVVPPGHEKMSTQQEILSMSWDQNQLNPYLSILPSDMTERWAGLGLVHELSHLRDAVLKIEPPQRTRDQYLEGEHKAYSVERALAFAYSNGRLQAAVETIVKEALSTQDPTSALNSLVQERFAFVIAVLNQSLDPSKPKSDGESSIRNGLYVMLIGFEIARQLSGGDPAQQKAMEKGFIEMIYEPTGHLPKR